MQQERLGSRFEAKDSIVLTNNKIGKYPEKNYQFVILVLRKIEDYDKKKEKERERVRKTVV